MFKRLVFTVFIGFSLHAQAQSKAYHIFAHDTCFYFLEGPNQEWYTNPPLDQYGNPAILDGVYPWWTRRPDAPDGTYYIYQHGHIFSKKKPEDTAYCEVITYKKGKAEGLAQTFEYDSKLVIKEDEYLDGKLLTSTTFQRKHKGEELGGFFYGFQVYPEHYYPFHDGEILTQIYKYDSTERVIETLVYLSSDSSKQLLFEQKNSQGSFGFYSKHYFVAPQPTLAQEILVDSTKLSLKRWCEDGELFYHLEEKIQPSENGTWFTLESKVIKNRFKVRAKPAYYYCE